MAGKILEEDANAGWERHRVVESILAPLAAEANCGRQFVVNPILIPPTQFESQAKHVR